MAQRKHAYLPQLLASEYASYRDEVIDVLVGQLDAAGARLGRPASLYDPMAGTAPLLPFAQVRGCRAVFNDINALHLHVNRAKSCDAYKYFRCIGQDAVLDAVEDLTLGLETIPRCPTDQWIQADLLDALARAWHVASAHQDESMVEILRALILLSVRQFASYSRTQNPTWIKRGGLRTKVAPMQVFRDSVDRLDAYYAAAYGLRPGECEGALELQRKDASSCVPSGHIDVVMTSPPFPNRVDWDRLYAPEHYFLDAVGDPHSRALFVGTSQVVPYLEFEADKAFVVSRSPRLGKFLSEVEARQIRHERKSNYYVKYFTRYFAGTFRVLEAASSVLDAQSVGLFYVVQDNVHRGLPIQLGSLIADALNSVGFSTDLFSHWDRHHLGLRNVSKQHKIVSPRQQESIWYAHR